MRLRAVLVGLAAYVAFAALLSWLYAPDPRGVVALAACPGPEAGAPAAAPFYRVLEAPSGAKLCGEFEGPHDLLVVPRLSGNALRVRVDGVERLAIGSPDRPANLWFQPQRLPLGDLAEGPHALEIELWGLYDLGLRLPPYFTTWETGGRRASALVWLSDTFVALAAGVNLGVGLLLLSYGARRRRYRVEALLFGATALAAALYVADYLPSIGFGDPGFFLFRRKLSLTGSLFVATTLVTGLEVSTRVSRRFGRFLIPISAVLAIAAWASPDQIALKRFSAVASVLFVPLAFYGVWLAVRHGERRLAPLWVFLGCSAVHLMFNLATGTGHLFLVHYGLLAGALASGLRITRQLAAMSHDLELASRAALTDALTGARNRAFCESLRISAGDVLAVVDFDRFKDVNDHHGHARGDRLLSDFVRVAQHRLRGTDHVIRLGGDEFALVLRDADLPAAARVVEEILAGWRSHATDLAPTASVGLAPVGARSFSLALAEADRLMYRAKTSRAAIATADVAGSRG